MTNPQILGVFLALFALLSEASAQRLPWRAKQEDALGGASRVLLVTPDVRVEKWTVTTGRETSATADHLRRTICGELDDLFEQRKLQVSDYLLCLGEGQAPVTHLDALRAVQARFRELVAAWERPGRHYDLLQGFHLGAEVEVTKKFETDVLIVVTAEGTLTSRGEKAMAAMGGLAGGSAAGQGLMVHFGVIRAQTGELLFFSEKHLGGDFLKHEDRLETAIQKSVQAAFAR